MDSDLRALAEERLTRTEAPTSTLDVLLRRLFDEWEHVLVAAFNSAL